MDTVRAFFTKSGHFFLDFQNWAEEASPLSPPSCMPGVKDILFHFSLKKLPKHPMHSVFLFEATK